MDRRYAELRLFEIRFTIKSQEDNAKVSGIQYLIDLTNSKIEANERRLKHLQDDIYTHQIRLSCIIYLLKLMLQHIGLPTTVMQILCGSLCHSVNNFLEQSWEEATYPAFDMMQHVGALRKDKSAGGDDYFSSEHFEVYRMDRFLKGVDNILASAMQLAIKVGADEPADDEFDKESGDRENDWVNEVPTGPVALLGVSSEVEVGDVIKEESEEEEE